MNANICSPPVCVPFWTVAFQYEWCSSQAISPCRNREYLEWNALLHLTPGGGKSCVQGSDEGLQSKQRAGIRTELERRKSAKHFHVLNLELGRILKTCNSKRESPAVRSSRAHSFLAENLMSSVRSGSSAVRTSTATSAAATATSASVTSSAPATSVTTTAVTLVWCGIRTGRRRVASGWR